MIKSKILFIWAHNDDAEIFVWWTLLLHQKIWYEIVLAIMDHDAEYRKEEQKMVDSISWFRSSYFNSEAQLKDILLAEEPSIVITHWSNDRHPDHRKVSEHTINAMKQLKIEKWLPKRFYYCSTYDNLWLDEDFSPTHYVDISHFQEEKLHLIKEFKSQNPEYWIKKSNVISMLYWSRIKQDFAEWLREIHYLWKIEPIKDLLY